MSIPSSLNEFNVAAAVGRMLDQPELWWQSLGLFVDHFADWGHDWQASVGDAALERKKVHAIRSAAANVGAERLSNAAAALEQFLLNAPSVDASGLVAEDLRKQLAEVFFSTWGAASAAWVQQSGELVNTP